jgi:hypothetical protein
VVPDPVAALAAPALFLAAGAGLQALLPRPLERSLVARAGLSYLLGAAWCATAVWAAGFLAGVAVARAAFLVAGGLAVAAGCAAVVWRRGDAGGWRPALRPGALRGRWARALLVAGALPIAGTLLADSLLHPVTDFDGRMTWGTAARYIQAERTVLPSVLVDAEAFVIHPRYPLAMPLLQVAAAELAATGIESRAVRPLYALFLPALLAALWPLLARVGGQRAAALALAAISFAPVLLWNQEIGPLGTYSDFALAAFLGAGLAVLLHPAARHQPWRGAVAGLLLAAAAETKNEGLLLAPVVLAAIAVTSRRRLAPALTRAAVVVGTGIALVSAWRLQIPNRNDEAYLEGFSLPAIVGGLAERLPEILEEGARRTFDLGSWGGIWVLPLLWLVGWRGLRSRAARVAGIALAAQVAVVLAAYAVAPDLAIVAVTWDRFLVQMLAPLAMLTAASGRAALITARLRSPS